MGSRVCDYCGERIWWSKRTGKWVPEQHGRDHRLKCIGYGGGKMPAAEAPNAVWQKTSNGLKVNLSREVFGGSDSLAEV